MIKLLRGLARNGHLLRNVSQIHIQKPPSMHLKLTHFLLYQVIKLSNKFVIKEAKLKSFMIFYFSLTHKIRKEVIACCYAYSEK